MNRKQIEAAGIGAALFYSTTGRAEFGAGAWCYRAVVESVAPRKSGYSSRNDGVEVTLWDEDGHQSTNSEWRADADTGMCYRRTVVPSAKLLGDWTELRTEQLAERTRRAAAQAERLAAADRAAQALAMLHATIGPELRERFGPANMHNYGSDLVEVPAALLAELVGGWRYATSAMGLGVAPPWRVGPTGEGGS